MRIVELVVKVTEVVRFCHFCPNMATKAHFSGTGPASRTALKHPWRIGWSAGLLLGLVCFGCAKEDESKKTQSMAVGTQPKERGAVLMPLQGSPLPETGAMETVADPNLVVRYRVKYASGNSVMVDLVEEIPEGYRLTTQQANESKLEKTVPTTSVVRIEKVFFDRTEIETHSAQLKAREAERNIQRKKLAAEYARVRAADYEKRKATAERERVKNAELQAKAERELAEQRTKARTIDPNFRKTESSGLRPEVQNRNQFQSQEMKKAFEVPTTATQSIQDAPGGR